MHASAVKLYLLSYNVFDGCLSIKIKDVWNTVKSQGYLFIGDLWISSSENCSFRAALQSENSGFSRNTRGTETS